ncbi:MAG TPA: DinB family protein [Chloroflexota bacterium]|jgi:hypothetical protein|nr:DinB family protein [Chloroflexota bacterium]
MAETAADRNAVLGEFETAREAFQESVRRAPDAALRYKPPGEDYALGGLVVHVSDVLRRYTTLLDSLRQHEFAAFTAPDHATPEEDATRIAAGFGGEARGPVLEEMRAAHSALVDAVLLYPEHDFTREAAVVYGSGDPYPTSPSHVVGWVADHYREHTQQVQDLVSAWAEATR